MNPSGVKMDRYWFNDNNRDDSWDAVWDVSVSRDRARLDGRVPHSVLAAALHAVRGRAPSASRCRGRSAGSNETSTWPLLSRSANGYVSSFGELGGLSMAASPKKLELVPYTRREPDAADDRRQPAAEARRARRRARPGPEVRADARPDVHRHHQPGLRPGRSGSGGREPDRVRDVLLRAAAVLRRGIRQLQLSTGLQRRRLHRAVLLAPRRPRAAGPRRSPERRQHLHRRAGADDDSRRRQADRARRQVLDRRDAGVHAGRDRARADRRGRRRSRRSSRRPATPSAASAASSRTSRRSA